MRKIKYLALLGIVGTVFGMLSTIPVANAHVGNNPHVPDARYNNYSHLNLDTDTFTTNERFQNAVQNVDANFSGIDLHFRSCSNPGKCIHVLKNVNCDPNGSGPDGCGKISLRIHHDSGPDDLVFQYPSGRPVNQDDACRGIQFLLGAHLHNGDGCMNKGPGNITTTICCGEGAALTEAYCAGCRPLPPGFPFDEILWIDGSD